MSDRNEKMFELDLEENGGVLKFESLEEIQNWVFEQRSLYEWTSKLNRAPLNQVWAKLGKSFNPITQQITTAINNKKNGAAFDGNIKQIENSIKNAYLIKKELFVSTHSNFQFIEQLKEVSEEFAAVALGQLIDADIYQGGLKSTTHLKAGLEAILFSYGFSDKTFEAEKEALSGLATKWESELGNYKERLDALEGEFKTTDGNVKSFFHDQSVRAKDFYEQNESELSDLKRTYDQYMALKAPVEYWEEKRKYHSQSAPKLKWWAIGLGTIGGIALSVMSYKLLNADKPVVWKFALLIIIATLLFWGLRILVRLFLSHTHLEEDARERVVMTKTYLALVRDENGIEQGDKNLILSTLFRPSTSGVVKDDGIPPGMYDIVTKLGTK